MRRRQSQLTEQYNEVTKKQPRILICFACFQRYMSDLENNVCVWDVLVAYQDTFFFSDMTQLTVIRNNHMSLYRPHSYHFPKCLFKHSGNPLKDLEDKNNGAFVPVCSAQMTIILFCESLDSGR